VRAFFVLLAAASLGPGLAACGGAGANSSVSGASSRGVATGGAPIGAASVASLPQIERKGDGEGDSDTYGHEPDNENELFGRPAPRADVRAVAALVGRYYAAAARDDGASACRLIHSTLATAIPKDYGGTAGPAYLRGRSCGTVMSKLFRHYRRRLSAEGAGTRVIGLRAEFNLGVAQLRLPGAKSARYIMVRRERGMWKIDMMLDEGEPVHVE
jgi:hypothetical protein